MEQRMTLEQVVAAIRAALDAGMHIDDQAVKRLADAHGVGEATVWLIVNDAGASEVRRFASAWAHADDETRRRWSALLQLAWELGQRGQINTDRDALASVEAALGVPGGLLLAGVDGVEPYDVDRVVADCMEG